MSRCVKQRGWGCLPELQFGPELGARGELADLDLAAQVLGDLPVYRVNHGASQDPSHTYRKNLWNVLIRIRNDGV